MKQLEMLLLLVLIVLTPPLSLTDSAPTTGEPVPVATDSHDQDRTALKQILGDIETSINAMDFDSLFKHFDENISVNFMTNDIAIGKDAILAYYDKMFKQAGAPLKSHKTQASLGAPAIFHGDTITAYGMAKDTFELKDGTVHQFDTRWTTSAVKKDGQWKVVSIHFSVNPLKNPILDKLTDKLGLFMIVAFIVGMVISLVISRFSLKRQTT